MTRKQLTKMIERFGGWWDECDREVARFPSVDAKQRFEQSMAAATKLNSLLSV